MPDATTSLHCLTRTLEDNAEGTSQIAVELLLFPGVSTFGHRERRVRLAVIELAEATLRTFPLDELGRRIPAGTPELVPTTLSVTPRIRSQAWSEPLEVTLDTVIWSHGAQVIACLPALSIAVIAPSRADLPGMLREHALTAIKRDGWNASLLRMAQLQRGRFALQSISWSPTLESPEARWKREHGWMKGPAPLDQLCTRMDSRFMPRAHEQHTVLAQLARLLTLPEKPSVLLVGPGGVGKTALVQEMVRTQDQVGLAGASFYRSSGARLIAGACGFGMWQQRCRELIEAARNKPVIFFLGNLFELLNVGQSVAGSESIASFLRPCLVRKEVQIIVECTPEQLSLVEKQDPRLSEAFRLLRVEEPSPAASDAILLASSLSLGHGSPRFTKQALQRVAALHRRFMGYAAFPGTPLRFMERVHAASDDRESLMEEADIYTAFSKETGMPRHLLDPREPLNLEEVHAWFSQRVQGQPAAVDVISSVIAQMKAGLSRPGRPLASLLFTGPTGTGKTEMAKALAEFLFQSTERMIRLDMSEYGQPWSAQRLVSGSHDGREGLLTAAVREQPFNVLLLDEFEKADPAVFDLLLQVLGEARLTDAAGRTADFSNCVVIMTSNLGAREHARGPAGFSTGQGMLPDALEHFTAAVQKELRPEMFNRIDRVVPYQPLTEDVILDLAKREVRDISSRSGLAGRKVALQVSDALISHLAARGYDPRYGARPMKRRIAEELLAPLAGQIITLPPRTVVQADLDDLGRLRLRTRAETAGGEASAQAASLAHRDLQERISQAARLRRAYQRLHGSTMVSGLTGRMRLMEQRLKAQAARARAASRTRQTWTGHDPELDALKACLARIQDETSTQLAHEEALILALHREDMKVLSRLDPLTQSGCEDLTLEAYGLWQPPPKRLVMVFRGHPGRGLFEFAELYRSLAEDLKGTTRRGLFLKKTPAVLLTPDGLRVHPDAPSTRGEQLGLWRTAPEHASALVLWIEGTRATMHLKNEGGLHLSKASRKPRPTEDEPRQRETPARKKGTDQDWDCRVDIHIPESTVPDLAAFTLPLTELAGLPDLESGLICRQYDPVKHTVREGASGSRTDGSFERSWLLQALRQSALREALT